MTETNRVERFSPREAMERDETFLNANMWMRSRCTGDSQEKNHLLIQTRHAKNEIFIMIHRHTSIVCILYFNWTECWACLPAMLNVPINKRKLVDCLDVDHHKIRVCVWLIMSSVLRPLHAGCVLSSKSFAQRKIEQCFHTECEYHAEKQLFLGEMMLTASATMADKIIICVSQHPVFTNHHRLS